MTVLAQRRPAALTTPRFAAVQFTPSGYRDGTPDRKARFANALTAFIAAGFPQRKFTTALYTALNLHFEHIAHGDRDGFFHAQFSTPTKRAAFLNQLILTCDRTSHTGGPQTWGDVQAALVTSENRIWLACQLDRL